MVAFVVRKRPFHRAGIILLDCCAADSVGRARPYGPRYIERGLWLLCSNADANALMAKGVIIDIHKGRAEGAEGRNVAGAVESLRRRLREGMR